MPDGPDGKPGMVFIPGGSFIMGSDQERPEERFSHAVTSMVSGSISTR